MDRVNITIAHTCKGPGRQKAVGMYLIECIHDGIPDTKYKCLVRESITSKELSLQLLANAIHMISRANADFDSVEIYSEEQYITNAFEQKWIEKWSENDWKNAKGKDVADAEIWQMIVEKMNSCGKRFIFCRNKSSYSNWMHQQMEHHHVEDGEIKPRLYMKKENNNGQGYEKKDRHD